MKKLNISAAFIAIGLLSSTLSFSQLNANGAYMMGNMVEIGIHNNGHEGTWDIASSHSRTTSWEPSVYLGFVANPQNNGWATYDGDFFTPGTPENGFGLEINGVNYSNNGSDATWMNTSQNEIPGSITGYQVIGDCIIVDWDGDINNVHIHVTYRLTITNSYYTTEVELTNNTGGTLSNLYYYRNVDPDNNVTINGGNYSTTNTIVSQPTGTCQKALVSAQQTNPWNSYMGFGAIGSNFRVTFGGFSNRDGSDIWNGTGGLTGTVNATSTNDEAISLAYRIASFAPGATETFSYVVILDASQVDAAVNSLFYFDYVGGLAGPTSECDPIIDTVETCSGLPVDMSIQGPNVPDYSWSWSPPTDLSTSVGPITQASPASTTTYTLTGTPINPCLTTVINKIIVVDVSAGPDILITDPGVQCSDFDLTTLVVTDQNATPGTTLSFHSAPPADATDMSNLWPSNIITSTDVVYVMIADPVTGCYDYEQVILTWGTGGVAGADNSVSYCNSSGTVDLNALLSGADLGGTWAETTMAPSGQFNTTTGVLDLTGLMTGVYTFTYTVAGCPGFDVADITISLGALDAGADNTASLCNSSGTTLDMNSLVSPGIAAGIWEETTASGQFNTTTGVFNASGVPANLYNFIYIVIGTAPCVNDTASFDISVEQEVSAGLDNLSALCNSGGNTIDLNTLLNGQDPGGFWSESSSSGQFNTASGIFNVAGLNGGNYTFQYTVNGTSPCPNDVSDFTITVHEDPVINAGTDVEVCDGTAVTLTGTGGGTGAVYTWDNGVTQGTSFTPIVGSLNYTVSVVDGNGCTGSDIINVTVNPNPTISFFPDTTLGCAPFLVEFTSMSNPAAASCEWTFGDGSSSLGCGMVDHVYTTEGDFDVSLEITSIDGCSSFVSIPGLISVEAMPVASFSYSPDISTIEDTEIEFTNASYDADTYFWTFGDNTPSSTVSSPIHVYPEIGNTDYPVTLIAYNAVGCSDTITKIVTIQDIILFYIPNAFTPDGDDFNETWKPVFYSGFDPYDFHMVIYNRWGEIVFESYNAASGWDGTYGDRGLIEEGVYIWTLDFKETMSDKRHKHQGHVTVLK